MNLLRSKMKKIKVLKKILWIVVLFIGINNFAQTKPVLSNFRVEDAHKDRVYFDTSGDITGMTIIGFVISGKTIKAVDTTNKYFTVDTPFTFWNNNTIRLGENTDTSHRQSLLYNFTLTYIQNNISEPKTNVTKYVTANATGDGDGSEANPWTLLEAADNAVPGTTVWVKAGDYGNIKPVWDNLSGTPTSPIKFIGYKNTIGDITSNYLNSYDDIKDNWNVLEMPTITGMEAPGNVSKGTYGAFMNGRYYIIRNIQWQNYGYAIRSSAGATADNSISDIVLDNINIRNCYNNTYNYGTAIQLYNQGNATNALQRIRVTNSMFYNNGMAAVTLGYKDNTGTECMIDNCQSHCDKFGSNQAAKQDYHFVTRTSNAIMRYNIAYNHSGDPTTGAVHGIGFRGASNGTEGGSYGLVEHNYVYNVQESIYARNNGSDNNVFKYNYCSIGVPANTDKWNTGGIVLGWGGADNNIFESNYITGTSFGVQLKYRSDEDSIPAYGSNNIARNNIFVGDPTIFHSEFFNIHLVGTAPTNGNTNNKIINNTIVNYACFFDDFGVADLGSYEVIVKNNIIKDIPLAKDPNAIADFSKFVFDYNNFYNSWSTGVGTHDINVDPQLNDNFEFTLSTPQSVSEGGITLTFVIYDFKGNERTPPYSIGAFQKKKIIQQVL